MSDDTSRAEIGKRENCSHPQKCNAKQPCTTCVNKDGGTACAYKRSRSSGRRPPKSPLAREVPLLAVSDPSESSSSNTIPPDLRELSSTPPGQLWLGVLDKKMPVPSSSASGAAGATESPPPSIVPYLTTLPSIQFQTIPRPLPLPLSLIPPERLQVSWVAGNDLDMTLYVIFSMVSGIFTEPEALTA